MVPLNHLHTIPLHLSPSGPSISSVLSVLRHQLPNDAVLSSFVWDSLEIPSQCPTLRDATPTGWTACEEVRSEPCPLARAAIHCLDVLNSFVSHSQYPEKIHISAFLSVRDLAEGEQGTASGTSLTLHNSLYQHDDENARTPPLASAAEQLPDSAFSDASTFIVGMKELKATYLDDFIGEDSEFSASVVVDINVMEDLRYERTADDNGEIIALAVIIGHVLLRLAGIESDGSFVKVHRDCPMDLCDDCKGRMLITARWPDLQPSVLKRAHTLRASWTGAPQDFVELRHVVKDITSKDGTRNIIVLGRTGSGKSYTGNWILRQICEDDSIQFMESESGSMTSFVERLPKAGTGNYCIWDTPGLDDAYGRDARYIDDIEKSILEMGTVSVIIMCFTSIERIEHSVRRQIAQYAKIIGTDLSDRVLVFVNRQARNITSIQKKNLMRIMKKEGNLALKEEFILDMGSNSRDLDGNRAIACRALLQMCGKAAVKMSYVHRLHEGLLQIQELENAHARRRAEDELVKMSADLLWDKFGMKNRGRPLSLQPSSGRSLVLSDRCYYKFQGRRVLIEHILELPESVVTLLNRMQVFATGFGSRHRHIFRLLQLVKRKRLVFMEMPKDKRYEEGGYIQNVLRIRYKLWVVSDALAEDVKQHIQKATGSVRETSVSAFGTNQDCQPS
eukprot:TRINITY_DN499_c0_g1_i1.p2 TRINITY_DN499_c0_g1~~TRINITY_DN499_c0_g1_i1.p2  ORF type:complete len:676 (+),score=100.90 TRINITY_DN499_c0_g1_i1:9919-11946(+)